MKAASYFFVASMIVVFTGCDPDETQTVVTFTNLVWEDNFDTNGAPNPANWDYEEGDGTEQGIPGWGNNELQFFYGQ